MVNKESWIIDGNYGGTLDIRFLRADTVILLDYKRYVCLYRVIKRLIQNFGKKRIDMADGCKEKIDFAFLKWIWEFPKKSMPIIMERMENFNGKKIILKKPKEAKLLLMEVENSNL
jgi:adenylate kinase family enzyme